MEDLWVVIVGFILMGLLALWFRHQARARRSEIDSIGVALGMRANSEQSSAQAWLDGCPPFRFLASGTNKRLRGRISGERNGIAFDVAHYRAGSQTSSHVGTEWLIFSTMVPTPAASPSFSLVPTQRLEQRVARTTATVVPMPGWTSLDTWSLWMHVDPTNPVSTSVSANMLSGVSALVDRGERVRVEFVEGHFVAYHRHKGPTTQADVERTIAVGLDLLGRLS